MDTWEERIITPPTMRLYSKIISAREDYRQFVARVRRQVNETYRIERRPENIESFRCYYQY